MNRKILLASVGAALAWSGAQPALAQAAQDGAVIDEIIVTARKRSEVLQDVPQAVDAFTGEELRRRGVIQFDNLSQVSPNVFLTRTPDSPAGLWLTIRGQSQPDIGLTTSSSVGVYVDGVYLPFQMGLRQAMYDVERVEILKGPQGTLYGKNTTGGAINVFTRQPGDVFEGYLQGTYARYDTRSLEGGVTVPLVPGVLSGRISGLVSRRDELARNDAGFRLDNDATDALRGHLRFTPNDRLTVSLSADMSRVRHGGGRQALLSVNTLGNAAGLPILATTEAAAELYGVPAGLTPANLAAAQAVLQGYVADGRDHGNSPARSAFDASGQSATIDYDFGWGALKSITSHRTLDRLDVIDTDATPFTIVFPTFHMRNESVSQEVNLGGQAFSDRLQWIVGGFYSRDSGELATTTYALALLNPTNPNQVRGKAKNETWAVYSQATFALTDAINLTGGYRYTEEKKGLVSLNRNALGCNVPVADRDAPGLCQGTFVDTFTGDSYLLSLDYKPTPDILVYAKTSRGFRGGGQNDRGTAVEGSFNEFQPETATDYEIGLKSDWWGRRLRLNLATYYIDYKQVQRFVILASPTGGLATVIANAADAHIWGFEAEAVARPADGLTLTAAIGVTEPEYETFLERGRDRSGEAWPVPSTQVSLSGDYAYPTGFGEVRAHLDWYWQSKVTFAADVAAPGATTQKAYGLLSARLNAHVDAWNADLAVFGTNLLGKRYLANAVALDKQLGYNVGYLGEPRILGVQATKRF